MSKRTQELSNSVALRLKNIDLERLLTLVEKTTKHSEDLQEKDETDEVEDMFVDLAEKLEQFSELLSEINELIGDIKERE